MMKTQRCLKNWALLIVTWMTSQVGSAVAQTQPAGNSAPAPAPAPAAEPGTSGAAAPENSEFEAEEENAEPVADGPLQYQVSDDVTAATSIGPSDKPDQYIVQLGDTLWDISSRFWGDPYFWPKLWSFNPYIGNAHLIYPGNILRFYAGNYVRPPSMDLESSGSTVMTSEQYGTSSGDSGYITPEGEGIVDRTCRPPVTFEERSGSQTVRSTGFIREEGFSAIGKVVKAPEPKLLFSERDILYLQFVRISEVQCGDIYTIYEPTLKRVYHPIYKGQPIGTLYRILGDVEIIDINEYVATARLKESFSEIERGDLVTAQISVYQKVEPQRPTTELDGYVVESLGQESETISPSDIVYIDRGQQDGVDVGDTFYIVRNWDGVQGKPLKRKKNETIILPNQIVGKLVVVKPGEYVSEAMVIDANDVIEVGDRIQSQVY